MTYSVLRSERDAYSVLRSERDAYSVLRSERDAYSVLRSERDAYSVLRSERDAYSVLRSERDAYSVLRCERDAYSVLRSERDAYSVLRSERDAYSVLRSERDAYSVLRSERDAYSVLRSERDAYSVLRSERDAYSVLRSERDAYSVLRSERDDTLRCVSPRCPSPCADLYEAVQEILPELREMGVTVWVMGSGTYPPDVINLQDLMDDACEDPVPAHLGVPGNLMATSICIFTSGTTGLPKAARISHLKSLLCCCFYQLCGASADDIIYLSLPLYHMSASLLGIGGCIGIGASVVLKERFSASQFWNDCRRYNVTIFQYIGELCRYLVNQPQCEEESRHSVRLAAGSGLRPDVWTDFSRRFGKIRIFETYGLTESNISFFNYTGSPGAVGRGSFIYKCFSPFALLKFD
ncbi:long-chain fatty acid transport protein 3-like, partial [Ascaphus truei]|uniref:long-chain fatty acid transport protein 3-like n=1 Tax=Ascaphus truei TaxID=8439 RepID=UPI003F59339B